MFGERLRRLRHELGIAQGELAKRSGINRSYLSMIENDRSSPTVEVVEKLAKGLGVSVWSLLAGVEEKHYTYDTEEAFEIYDGLRQFLEDEDLMILTQPTEEEIKALKGISFRGFQPDKRFYRDALLAYRRRQRSNSSGN